MRWLVVVILIAMMVAVVGLAASREAGQSSAGNCLSSDDAPVAGSAGPAVIALLGDEIDRGAEFSGPHVNRLLRISLPGGEVQRERTLVQLPNGAIGREDSFRLNVPSAPLLDTAPDGRIVVALVREPAPGRDSVAVIDAASLETRCSHPLEKDVRYSGLLLGRSGRVYAYGSRPAQTPGRWDAVLTILDGKPAHLRAARRCAKRSAADGGDPARTGPSTGPHSARTSGASS